MVLVYLIQILKVQLTKLFIMAIFMVSEYPIQTLKVQITKSFTVAKYKVPVYLTKVQSSANHVIHSDNTHGFSVPHSNPQSSTNQVVHNGNTHGLSLPHSDPKSQVNQVIHVSQGPVVPTQVPIQTGEAPGQEDIVNLGNYQQSLLTEPPLTAAENEKRHCLGYYCGTP